MQVMDRVFVELSDSRWVTRKALASYLGVEARTAGAALNRLRAGGMVESRRARHDRRRLYWRSRQRRLLG